MGRFRSILWPMLVVIGAATAAAAPCARAGVDIDFGAEVSLGDDADLFFRISSRHYERDRDEVRAWSRSFPAPDDLAVALHLAHYCDRGPEFFLSLRRQGVGWFEISRRCQVPVDVWFVPVQRDPGPPYGKAYGYWRKHQRDPRAPIALTDRQVRDLVAVRMLHDYYEVPVETAMSWRARGADVRTLVVREYDRRHRLAKPADRRDARSSWVPRGKSKGGPGKSQGGGKGHGHGHGNGRPGAGL